jgi:hypothetical protein
MKVEELFSAGIHTFVVGIPGSDAYAPTLDALAQAGGEINPQAPPLYFAVSASGGVSGLNSVLTKITETLVTSCRLQLMTMPPDLGKLNVSVDGTTIAQKDPHGWDLDTSTTPPTVVLQGQTCALVETTGVQRVQVVYGCPTVVLR